MIMNCRKSKNNPENFHPCDKSRYKIYRYKNKRENIEIKTGLCDGINPLPHRDAFQHFCKQSRPRSGSTLFAYGNMIRYDPTLVT